MKELESVVIRFSGDSGDGMQLTGTMFSNASALMGNDISTFPDYPSEIRAPQGTIAGVSGFQVHFGSVPISTPGDQLDVLVAMNPAALKANLPDVKKNGIIIVNVDSFNEKNLQKAGYEENPLESERFEKEHKILKVNMIGIILEALKDLELDNKLKERCKNFCALGLTFKIFNRSLDSTLEWIEKQFESNPTIVKANMIALKSGYDFAQTFCLSESYSVAPAKIKPGTYRQLNGNMATAWGFIQAAKSANLELFIGSYPITPASEILHELAKHKRLRVKSFQAEDELAGICSAIGASFAGALAVTTTSGPGLALKGEAMGLATIYELPLVVVNVQRGGPSTGLPTKTEQADLKQAFYGRHGECPMIIIAASSPADCFFMAYEASRLSLEHMTPVILLTDGYIANGACPWRVPDVDEYPPINVRLVDPDKSNGQKYMPYLRDEKTLVRSWAYPGMKGFEHRIGGLEKENITGAVSHNPQNHEIMVKIRAKKVELVADNIPKQELEGEKTGDLLVVSWGGTYGSTHLAVAEMQKKGHKVSLMHLKYLNPLPKNVGKLFSGFSKIIVAELNMGQLKGILQEQFCISLLGYNKIQGLPFNVSELVNAFAKELEK